MSEFHVPVVKLRSIGRVPNADTLSVTNVFDYPVVFRTGEFDEGDLAVFVPVDAIMPDRPEWIEMLGPARRVKMKKLRGVPSRGLLIKPLVGMEEGQDVRDVFGITNYVSPAELDTGGLAAPRPAVDIPSFDIEGLLRYPHVLIEGEEVVVSEKCHGCQSRYVFHEDKLHVASKGEFKCDDQGSVWWTAARHHGLFEKLALKPGLVLYGEVYGQVQDLKYGIEQGVRIAAFDMYGSSKHRWFDFDEFVAMTDELGIPRVPVLYRGPWNNSLRTLCDGKSIFENADHVREGFVVKPVKERIDVALGRVVLKLVGEDYHMRKGEKMKKKR